METNTTSYRPLLPKLTRLILMPSQTVQMVEETKPANTDNKMRQASAAADLLEAIEKHKASMVLKSNKEGSSLGKEGVQTVLEKPAIEKKEKACRSNVLLPAFKIPSTPLLKLQKRPPSHALVPLPLLPPGGYSCGVCGLRFFSFPQLVRHKQFHDEDRPFPCGVCGKRFLSRSHYSEHQRVHTGERPFPCDMCERSFTTHHNLKRHTIIHSKEEMYRCRTCAVLFCQRHEYPQGMPRMDIYEPELEAEDGELADTADDQSQCGNPLTENPYPNDTEMADETENTDCTTDPTYECMPQTLVVTLPNPDVTSKRQGSASPFKCKSTTLKLRNCRSPYFGTQSKRQAHRRFKFPDLTSTFLEVTRNLANYDKKKKKYRKKQHEKYTLSGLQEEKVRGRQKLPKLRSVAYDIEVVL